MRKTDKTLTLQIDGKPTDFRLTKLDAFSGAFLLRMLAKLPGEGKQGDGSARSAAGGTSEPSPTFPPLFTLFTALSDADLRSLMTTCLQHAEVLLPAGWIPVMTRGEWSYPELEHDTATCLKLTLEEALWTLEGFFGGSDSKPPPVIPAA